MHCNANEIWRSSLPRRTEDLRTSSVAELMSNFSTPPGAGKEPRLGRSSSEDGGGEPEACRDNMCEHLGRNMWVPHESSASFLWEPSKDTILLWLIFCFEVNSRLLWLIVDEVSLGLRPVELVKTDHGSYGSCQSSSSFSNTTLNLTDLLSLGSSLPKVGFQCQLCSQVSSTVSSL